MTDVTSQTGITFQHTDGGSGEGYVAEGIASGIVMFDYDQDGWMDIYFLNGSQGADPPTPPTRSTATMVIGHSRMSPAPQGLATRGMVWAWPRPIMTMMETKISM